MIEWTAEKVASLSVKDVQSLRANAIGKREDIVALCDDELDKRRPKKNATPSSRLRGGAVAGFHFVCDKGQGVTKVDVSHVWTGTWVVSKDNAEKAAKIGSYVALHEVKAEPSYLQGIVKDWRVSHRERKYAEGQIVKTPTGIDFLIELVDTPYTWIGEGAGEKGYAWKSSD